MENVAIRPIQDTYLKVLQKPSRKMAKKPLLAEKMMAKKLEFSNEN